MVKTAAVSELKAHCLQLLDEVARRPSELVVTKRGKPFARVDSSTRSPPGQLLRFADPPHPGVRIEH
jgi:prevent-host-death family protein